MKKVLLGVLVAGALLTSCKKDCTQEAYSEKFTGLSNKGDQVLFCHDGKQITANEKSDHGSTHDDGTECYTGECGTLSSGNYSFGDGVLVDVPCHWELPTIITDPITNEKFWITESK